MRPAKEVYDAEYERAQEPLRKKLGDDPSQPRFVQTVRGVGYRMGRGQ